MQLNITGRIFSRKRETAYLNSAWTLLRDVA